MLEINIDSIRPSPAGDLRMVLLRVKDSSRYLSVWIRAAEADAIQAKLQNVPLPRPMTHDLLNSVIQATGSRVSRVVVSDIREDTFFATIVLEYNGTTLEVDSRPSDAIALAVRSEAPIFAENAVIEKAGFELEAASGILEITSERHGFLRQVSVYGTTGDVYISEPQIRLFGLNVGDSVTGQVGAFREGEQHFRLVWVDKINGQDPTIAHDLRSFDLPVLLAGC